MSSFEQLDIVPIEKVNEIFVLSDPVVEPELKMEMPSWLVALLRPLHESCKTLVISVHR